MADRTPPLALRTLYSFVSTLTPRAEQSNRYSDFVDREFVDHLINEAATTHTTDGFDADAVFDAAHTLETNGFRAAPAGEQKRSPVVCIATHDTFEPLFDEVSDAGLALVDGGSPVSVCGVDCVTHRTVPAHHAVTVHVDALTPVLSDAALTPLVVANPAGVVVTTTHDA